LNAGNLLPIGGTVSFSRRTLLCGVSRKGRELLKDVTMHVKIILKWNFNEYAVKNCNGVIKEGQLQREGMS
jgi:hypothetical protein